MKYTGSILGFRPSNFNSIYTIITDDKVYTWRANVVAEIADSLIKLSFNWNGDLFELQLRQLKDGYYDGKIIYNRTSGGSCYFWLYERKDGLILKGDFIEDDAGTYDCIIELRKIDF